ncbi:MAG: class I SAM-dependent methyltransferase [Chlamydiae bacterium]|nr:class I SAM-dependent methyltransferase [Chlamydiota bacterium]MBI3266513.1 class I SAM-dependent methyltransferase [Chlamydiota bacterium]
MTRTILPFRMYLGQKDPFDWEHFQASYKSYVKETFTVLEIGASVRERTVELAKHCHRLIGIEYFPDRVPQNSSNVEYLVGDWQNLTQVVKPESIDIVVSSHVIEHVQDDLKALHELYAVLKGGACNIEHS